MKKLNLKIVGVFIFFTLTITSFAQNWRLGGNTVFPGGGINSVNATNNIMGTVAGANFPINIITNGTVRMVINNGATGINDGKIAIGNNLAVGFTPSARLHLHQDNGFNHIQFTSNTTIGGTTPILSSGFHIGINNANEATLRQRENEAMRFYTRNAERMYINPNRVSTINGFTNINTTGYVGIGPNNTSPTHPNGVWDGVGPFSLLHLNGAVNSNIQLGYLPWMRTGITLTDDSDLSYFGLRQVSTVGNITETVILWSNDDVVSTFADDMVFRFARTASPPNANINTVDLDVANDLDGRHIARFTGTGEFGLGATFGRDNTAYVLPASLMHMSRTRNKDVYMQITNRGGTGETVSDGLRIGITGTGTAHIRQQEDLPLIFYTNSIENGRMIPNIGTTLIGNPTMVGIGNWTTPFNILPNNVIDAKLDIDGDLRIRTIDNDDALSMVLVVDPMDHNRVHWRDATTIGGGGSGGVTADNGLTIGPNINNVQLGNDVGLKLLLYLMTGKSQWTTIIFS